MLRFLKIVAFNCQVKYVGAPREAKCVHALSFVELTSAKITPIESRIDESAHQRDGPSTTSCVRRRRTVEELQLKLEHAEEASHTIRKRITLCTTFAGIIPLNFVSTMYYLNLFFMLDPYTFGDWAHWASTAPWFMGLMCLGLMPNDESLIHRFFIYGTPICIMCGMSFVPVVVYSYVGQPEIPHRDSHEKSVYMCKDASSMHGCFVWMSRWSAIGFVWVFFGIIIIFEIGKLHSKHNLNRDFISSSRKDVRDEQYVFRLTEKIVQIPGRPLLETWWLIFRFTWFIGGIVYTSFAIALELSEDQIQFHARHNFVPELACGCSWILASFAFRTAHRHTFMAFLQSVNTKEEANAAATIAALLGNSNTSHSLQLAKERFRSINFSKLRPEDFMKSKESQAKKNELFGRTTKAKLGSCDAFLSHSWTDNGEKKYRALRRWAIDFKIKNGRDPEIWLDKACIDQQKIADDLMCLPIFTSGCETLLIVAGPTYVKRLWCIIEMFVFLKMGGDPERITVIPIDMTEGQAKNMFQKVDASKSECFLESDRQKLLGIIEQGFGNFTTFNRMLRGVFESRATATNVFGSMRLSGRAADYEVDNLTSSRSPSSTKQVIVESAPGENSVQPMVLDVEPTATVGDVEIQVQDKIQNALKCIGKQHIVLIHNGIQLRSCYSLQNYNIENNETIHVVFPPPESRNQQEDIECLNISDEMKPIEMTISRFDAEPITIKAKIHDTVFGVKRLIQERINMPTNRQRLLHITKVKEFWLDDDKTLRHYQIGDGASLYLIRKRENIPFWTLQADILAQENASIQARADALATENAALKLKLEQALLKHRS